MPQGTVKRLARDRGFGFITGDDGIEYFFHRSATRGDFDSLREGQRVSFQVEAGLKGPRASSVRIEP
jgi:CspA family cold shock protein